jgi:hypothetical protein
MYIFNVVLVMEKTVKTKTVIFLNIGQLSYGAKGRTDSPWGIGGGGGGVGMR